MIDGTGGAVPWANQRDEAIGRPPYGDLCPPPMHVAPDVVCCGEDEVATAEQHDHSGGQEERLLVDVALNHEADDRTLAAIEDVPEVAVDGRF